jgi:hypothetical protein
MVPKLVGIGGMKWPRKIVRSGREVCSELS